MVTLLHRSFCHPFACLLMLPYTKACKLILYNLMSSFLTLFQRNQIKKNPAGRTGKGREGRRCGCRWLGLDDDAQRGAAAWMSARGGRVEQRP
uniref:Uncharacterized protein n=1 Tax=Leersia perrieri TaxID=77586 RepID=A0A0D9W4D2_9ORYZ